MRMRGCRLALSLLLGALLLAGATPALASKGKSAKAAAAKTALAKPAKPRGATGAVVFALFSAVVASGTVGYAATQTNPPPGKAGGSRQPKDAHGAGADVGDSLTHDTAA